MKKKKKKHKARETRQHRRVRKKRPKQKFIKFSRSLPDCNRAQLQKRSTKPTLLLPRTDSASVSLSSGSSSKIMSRFMSPFLNSSGSLNWASVHCSPCTKEWAAKRSVLPHVDNALWDTSVRYPWFHGSPSWLQPQGEAIVDKENYKYLIYPIHSFFIIITLKFITLLVYI